MSAHDRIRELEHHLEEALEILNALPDRRTRAAARSSVAKYLKSLPRVARAKGLLPKPRRSRSATSDDEGEEGGGQRDSDEEDGDKGRDEDEEDEELGGASKDGGNAGEGGGTHDNQLGTGAPNARQVCQSVDKYHRFY